MTTLYSDNFDSDTVGQLPSGWTAVAGAWAVTASGSVSGANALSNTSNGGSDAVLYTGGASTADGVASFTTRYLTAAGAALQGILFRMDSAYQNGYFLGYIPSSGTISFFKRVSGSYAQVASGSVGSSLSAPGNNDVLAQEVRFYGSTIEYRIWNVTKGQTRPSAASYTFSDNSKLTAGYCGAYSGAAGTSPIDDFVITDVTITNIAANDNAFLSSPGNWRGATATNDISVNAGAYKRIFINGACNMLFDTSALGSPTSKIAWRIDGGPWNDTTVAASIPVTIPTALSAATWHQLEIIIVSTSETINRWTGTPATAVVFLGLSSATGGFAVAAPVRRPGSVMIFGDSITEAVRVVNQTAANDTDRNDSRLGWALALGEQMGLEVGVVGFGATGWTVGGSGNVPALPNSYNLVFAGAARSWPSDLRAIFINMGTNDGGASDASVAAAVQTAVNGMLSATSASAPSVVVMRPFNGAKASAIQAGVTAIGSSRVFYEDTTGVLDTNFGMDSLNLHPTAANDRGRIVPALLAKLGKYGQPRRFTVTAA